MISESRVTFLSLLALLGLALAGCGPSGHYSHSYLNNGDADGSGGGDATVDQADAGPVGTGGSGGSVVGTGGTGSGGMGIGGGGAGSGGAGTGGTGTGGAATGGTGTGGRGTGGAGTGGSGTGGTSTGGTGTGGRGTGGAGTGGAGTGGAGTGGSGGPRIISIDFVGGQAAMTLTEVAGVKPAACWNGAPGISGSLAALIEKDGGATSANVMWNAGGVLWRLSWADAPGNTRMMNGYLDPLTATAPATVTVTGLPSTFTTGGYDVYVYAYGPVSSGTRTSKYEIGSSEVTVSQAGPTATSFTSFTQAMNGGMGNYVLFRNVTGSSFTFTATPGTASGTQTRAPVNGIQIVSPSGS